MSIGLLSFSGSLATKCMSLNNEPCLVRPTLIDLIHFEFNKCSFMFSVNNPLKWGHTSSGSFSTAGRTY